MVSRDGSTSKGGLWHRLHHDALWQLFERGTRVALGFLLSVLIARTVGPAEFGLYSYALTLVALFAFLGQAGLDALLVRELVRQPERTPATLGEGLVLRLAGASLAAVASATIAILFSTRELDASTPLVMVFSLAGVMQAGWVVESYLQATKHFRQIAIAKMIAYTLAALARLLALQTADPLPLLAAATVFESLLCALLLWRVSRRDLGMGLRSLQRPSADGLATMARMTLPMLLSALTIAIYTRIDVFMLGRLVGSEAAGLYTAGTLLSEGFYLLPTALMAAVAPRLAALFIRDAPGFSAGLHQVIRYLSAAGLAIAVVATLAAPFAVELLFGTGYAAAADVLRIHIWSTWAVFVSSASDPWYINHDLRKLYLAKTATAAVLNVALNLALIPRYGPEGAAWATLIAYATSAILMGSLWPATRPLFRMQLRAMAFLPPKADAIRRD